MSLFSSPKKFYIVSVVCNDNILFSKLYSKQENAAVEKANLEKVYPQYAVILDWCYTHD